MVLDASFYDTLSRLKLAMRYRSTMALSGNRKSTQKGSSTEFSDFREYMPGDDIRRIDWNAYGRLDRLYVKEYMEEKEIVVSILLDTSASMDYGAPKKSELACRLAAAMAYLSLSGMDRVRVYDMQHMQAPLVLSGGKKALPKLTDWLGQRTFDGRVDVAEAVRKLDLKGPGVTILLTDFLQEDFLDAGTGSIDKLLRYLDYARQKTILLHILAKEELHVEYTGTRNLIDMEDGESLRLTLDDTSIRVYEKALQAFIVRLQKACARVDAVHAVCSTGQEFRKLIFEDLRMLYDS
ncbi:MAG: DUF58 domain-containing protein [Lachnospiraceae bacterium]|nr:DUF58 domain-containing protein [Lachnospiraceae bacterium]